LWLLVFDCLVEEREEETTEKKNLCRVGFRKRERSRGRKKVRI